MVAGADCDHAFIAGDAHILITGQCRGPVYLHLVLRRTG